VKSPKIARTYVYVYEPTHGPWKPSDKEISLISSLFVLQAYCDASR